MEVWSAAGGIGNDMKTPVRSRLSRRQKDVGTRHEAHCLASHKVVIRGLAPRYVAFPGRSAARSPCEAVRCRAGVPVTCGSKKPGSRFCEAALCAASRPGNAALSRRDICPEQRYEVGMTETDIVIIGAGHNGLTCAAYLAMAGLRVKV